MNMLRLTLLFPLLLCSLAARADMVVSGAGTDCIPDDMMFDIYSVHDSDPPADGQVIGGQLPYGSHNLRCQMGRDVVTSTINVYPPAAKGMCMGTGYVSIVSLSMNKTPIIDRPTHFNWTCPGNEVLTGITVRVWGSKVLVERCTAKGWSWDDGLKDKKCTTQEFAR